MTRASARPILRAVDLASIALAVFGFGSMVFGVLMTPMPPWGAVFSFAAPALALSGLIAGRVATSRAKDAGLPTTMASVGSLLSGLCLLPALMTAMTCGVCNALLSTGRVETHRSLQWSTQPPAQPSAPPAIEPPQPESPRPPGAPPPAFPPPPVLPKPAP